MAEIRIGISGWTYAPWRGRFYPKGLKQASELAYASRVFNALEVNGTFYSLQRPSSYADWYAQAPPGFVFALKGGRFITHLRRLREPRVALANFFASGPLCLKEKLGPILWQFPPQMKLDLARLREFLELLPRDTIELAQLAQDHEARFADRVALEPDARRPVRHAIEFRHESFLTGAFIDLLREFNVALVAADVAGKYPTAEDVPADFVYVRLHGSRRLYVSGYTPRELDAWAEKVEAWRSGGEPADARRIAGAGPRRRGGRDVFIFFDNTDVKVRAPVDARNLARRLGLPDPGPPAAVMAALATPDDRARARRPQDSARRGRGRAKARAR